MSSTRDPEPEVNEKLLNQGRNNNQDTSLNGQHHHHPYNHHSNGNNSNSNSSINGKLHHHPNNHYQNVLMTRTQGTSTSLGTGTTTGVGGGSQSDLKSVPLHAMHDLERQLNRIKCYLKAISVVCLVFFLITIITFSVLFVQFRHDLDHHTHKPKVGEQVAVLLQHKSLCVPCSEYRLGPSPEEERMLNTFSLNDSSNGLMCCVDTPQELLDLLKLFVERRFRQEMAKGTINPWPRTSSKRGGGGGDGDGNRQPIAAHLLMTKQDTEGISQIPGRQYTIGRWIHESDMAFTIGTSYQHGRIVIPEDGFYFVYSQISFMEYYSETQNNAFRSSGTDSPSLSLYLYRYNIHYRNGGEEKLAQNSITKCWGQSRQFGEYANYIGAVFFLRNSDEIFIKVSNISMVNTEHKLSYFGLFQI